ncbi:MAG: hypothetical protein ACTHOM_00515 [Allomuricauda sp.]
MRKAILFLAIIHLSSCDPEKCSSFYFQNGSEIDIELNFVEVSSEKITIAVSNKVPFGNTSCDIGGPPILYLGIYDSIYITNTSNEILKVYKEDTPGKNIYNVDRYWNARETKNHTEYTYIITQEDIE